jgi:hypothetical protein
LVHSPLERKKVIREDLKDKRGEHFIFCAKTHNGEEYLYFRCLGSDWL